MSALLILSPAPRGTDTWSSSSLSPCWVSDEMHAESGPDSVKINTARRQEMQEDEMRQAAEEGDDDLHTKKVSAAEAVQQVRLLRTFQNNSGIYEFDWTSVQPVAPTPGKLREMIGAHTGYQQHHKDTDMKKELSWLRSVWSRMKSFSVKEWCEEAILNTIVHVMQFHVQVDMDTRGIPYLILHTRIRVFDCFETPWRLVWKVSLDGNSEPTQNLNFRNRKVYSFFTSMQMAEGCLGITQFQYSTQPHPGFPQEMQQSRRKKQKQTGQNSSKPHPPVVVSGEGGGVWGAEGGGVRGSLNGEKLFLLRTSEFVNNGDGVAVQSGYLNGHGKFTYRWKRVAPVDKSLIVFDEVVQSTNYLIP